MVRFRRHYWFWIAIALLVVVRFVNLASDPPETFINQGQSLITDPYSYTYSSRHAVLYDDGDPFEYERHYIFKHSLVSWASYIAFQIAGVSRVSANVTAIFLSLGGAFFFLFAIYDRKRPSTTAIAALLLLTNATFFFYSRYPLLENGLIFFAGLIFFLFHKYHHSYWGLVAIGSVITMAAVVGKLFGWLLLAPVIVCLIVQHGRQSGRPVLTMLLGTVTTLLLFFFLLFDGSISEYSKYMETVTTTIGESPGLTSPFLFSLGFLSFFTYPGLLNFSSVTIITSLLGWLSFVFFRKNETTSNGNLSIIFASVWILSALVAFAPHEYQPTRYALFLFLPMSLMAAFLCRKLLKNQFIITQDRSKLFWLSVPVCFSLMISVAAAALTTDGERKQLMVDWVVPIIAFAIAFTIIIYFVIRKRTLKFGGSVTIIAFIVIFAPGILQGGYYIFKGLSDSRYEFQRINYELSQLLDENTIISGPLGPAFSIDNSVKGIFNFFGPTQKDNDFFDRYPVTHVAIGADAWRQRPDQFGQLSKSTVMFSQTIRGTALQLLRVNSPTYIKSDYDRLIDLFYAGNVQSAHRLADSLLTRYPTNQILLLLKLDIMHYGKLFPELIYEIDRVSGLFANSYNAQWVCAIISGKSYHAAKDTSFRLLADKCLKRANGIYPGDTDSLEKLLTLTKRMTS